MSTRILSVTGTVYPKAELIAVNANVGVATFRWLDAGGNPVDSGGSVARFTPLDPLPGGPFDPVSYPEVDDATLIAAIENLVAAVVEVPATVTRRQLLLALNAQGITRAMIRTQLAGNEASLIEFDEAANFDRSHALVAGLAAALGLTSEQADDLYRAASVL